MAGLAITLFVWWLLPEYALPRYRALFDVMPIVLPVVAVSTLAVHFYTEWRLGPYDDSALHFGYVIVGRWPAVDWRKIREGLFGWFVRCIFLPLNFCGLVDIIVNLHQWDFANFSNFSWPQCVAAADTMIWLVLIAAIVPGYFFSARLLGTHIRKVEQSWFGWVVTLSCYPPFWKSMLSWLQYHPYKPVPEWAQPWTLMLQDIPAWGWFAGTMVLLFELIYYWGEAIFGLRASNLSNRGIITNGPYRYCKHPVYGIKCIAWALIWLPFVMGEDVVDCFRLTLLWGGVCGIYFMRAWVEERLLSTDPDYAAYALWIDRHGWFRWLQRLSPIFSFAWRLKHWRARDNSNPQPAA